VERRLVAISGTTLQHAIPHIPTQRGFKCTHSVRGSASSCGRICRNLGDMHKHCQAEHQWQNTRGAGRVSTRSQAELEATQARGKMWIEDVSFQQVFRTGQSQRLFEVSNALTVPSGPIWTSIIPVKCASILSFDRASEVGCSCAGRTNNLLILSHPHLFYKVVRHSLGIGRYARSTYYYRSCA